MKEALRCWSCLYSYRNEDSKVILCGKDDYWGPSFGCLEWKQAYNLVPRYQWVKEYHRHNGHEHLIQYVEKAERKYKKAMGMV